MTNLPLSFTEDNVCKLLQDVGQVEQCGLVRSLVGTFTGCAYVTFKQVEQVESAIESFKEEEINVSLIDAEHEEELRLIMIGTWDERFQALLKEVPQLEHKQFVNKLSQQEQMSTPIMVQESPRVSVFSGMPGKDSSFGRWKYEVECLQNSNTYSADIILHAVRQSLRSPAAELITHLDKDSSLTVLIGKLESIYGIVLSGQALLQRFYSEAQRPGETCAQSGLAD